MKTLSKLLFFAYVVGWVAIALSYCTACALPVGQIDLAGCTDKCNASSRVCFDNADDAAAQCITPDASNYERTTCVETQTKTAESCINNLVSCVSACVEETQKQLGGK